MHARSGELEKEGKKSSACFASILDGYITRIPIVIVVPSLTLVFVGPAPLEISARPTVEICLNPIEVSW